MLQRLGWWVEPQGDSFTLDLARWSILARIARMKNGQNFKARQLGETKWAREKSNKNWYFYKLLFNIFSIIFYQKNFNVQFFGSFWLELDILKVYFGTSRNFSLQNQNIKIKIWEFNEVIYTLHNNLVTVCTILKVQLPDSEARKKWLHGSGNARNWEFTL